MEELKRIINKNIIMLCSLLLVMNTILYIYKQLNGKSLNEFREDNRRHTQAITEYNEGGDFENVLNKDELLDFRRQIGYVKGYNKYVQQVLEEAEKMSGRAIFAKENSFAYKNIRLIKKEYRKLEDVNLTLEDNRGLESYLNYNYTAFIVLIMMLIIIFYIFKERDYNMWPKIYAAKRGRLYISLVRLFTIFISSLMLYLVASALIYFASVALYGRNHNLGTYIQNIIHYKDFTDPLSKMSYMLFLFVFQWLIIFAMSLTLYCFFSFFRERIKALLISGIIFGAELLLYTNKSSITFFATLRQFNIICALSINDLLCKYEAISLFGLFARNIFLIGMCVAVILIIAFVSAVSIGVLMRPVRSGGLMKLLSQKISTVRQIILAKQPVFMMEMHKTFFTARGYIVFIVAFGLSIYFIGISGKTYSSIDNEHDEMYLRYGGEDYSGFISLINNQEQKVADALAYLELVKERDADEKEKVKIISYANDNYQYELQILQSYSEFQEKIDYLNHLSDEGKTGYMISDRGYEFLFSEKGKARQIILQVLLLFGTLLIVNSSQYIDKKSKMNKLINSSANGRKKHMVRKICSWYITSLFLTGIIYLLDFGIFVKNYGIPYVNAPICSLSYMGEYSDNITIAEGVIMLYIIQIIFVLMISTIICGLIGIANHRKI